MKNTAFDLRMVLLLMIFMACCYVELESLPPQGIVIDPATAVCLADHVFSSASIHV